VTVNLVYAGSSDGYLRSYASSYSTALAGNNLSVYNTETTNLCGQFDGSYYVLETFESFTFTPAADEHVVAAHATLHIVSGHGTDVELRKYDWGSSLTDADWRTPSQLSALTSYGGIASLSATGKHALASDDLLVDVRAGGTVRAVGCTRKQRLGSYEYKIVTWYSADRSGTDSDPVLAYSTVPESTLHHVMGAQVQLSDGSWACLNTDGNPSPPTVTLVHVTAAGSASTVATVPTGTGSAQFGYPAGGQGYALAVDDQDNLYVVAKIGSAANTLLVRPYIYAAGSWTAGDVQSVVCPSAVEEINQVVATWHNIGTAGSLLVLAAHGFGDPGYGGVSRTDVAWLSLSCDYLLNGTGSLLRASGNAVSAKLTAADEATTTSVASGSLLDIAASSSTRGYVACSANSRGYFGSTGEGVSLSRYILGSGGTTLTAARSTGIDQITFDSAARVRVIAIDDTRLIAAYVDPNLGLVIEDVQNVGTSTTFSRLGYCEMDAESLTTLPAGASLSSESTWDAVYNSVENLIYVYYLDSGDNNRLMRTSINLSTHLPVGDETQISAAIGAGGSTNHAIRVERGAKAGESVLIAVANETGGGTLSTIYVVDGVNLPPTGPTLAVHDNFDASASTTFSWTFNDPTTGDTQSAYELQINTALGASAYDTGKVASAVSQATLPASTISNDADWQWRVKTWDSADAEGEWSDYGAFSTSSTGVLTITDPATDNPALEVDSYTVTWSVSGAVQDHYRVVVVDTVTSTTVNDTGSVAGSATSYEVTGMSTDVQYRVEVTATDSGVDTNTATRLLTPSYSDPGIPTIALTASDSGAYILVAVTNPTPSGQSPDALYNDILRRVSGSDDAYELVGTAPNNGTFADFTVASGTTYEYVARAQA
jgi:hypothetical protein